MPDTANKNTSHINPRGAPITEAILLSGDPLHAKFVAETYLDDVVQFNEARNMLGFTGTYQGQEMSVMSSGMGIPPISLYSWELTHAFGRKKLIRVGSYGALQPELDLHDVIIGQTALIDSSFLLQYNLPGTFAPPTSFRLIEDARNRACEQGTTTRVGNILSSDVFYSFQDDVNDRWARMGVLAVKMESAGLYATTVEAGVEAMRIFIVSDNTATGGETTPEEREKAFTTMMELALPLARLWCPGPQPIGLKCEIGKA